MTSEPAKKNFKQKFTHEMREMFGIFLYLAIFLCSLATYSTLMFYDKEGISYFAYETAIINALVMSKVILIGEYFKIGKKHENRPLIITAIIKSFLFSVLMTIVHVAEEVIKGLFHDQRVVTSLRELAETKLAEILVRHLVIFCALVPFFAFWEIRRAMGEERFNNLLFHEGTAALKSSSNNPSKGER